MNPVGWLRWSCPTEVKSLPEVAQPVCALSAGLSGVATAVSLMNSQCGQALGHMAHPESAGDPPYPHEAEANAGGGGTQSQGPGGGAPPDDLQTWPRSGWVSGNQECTGI